MRWFIDLTNYFIVKLYVNSFCFLIKQTQTKARLKVLITKKNPRIKIRIRIKRMIKARYDSVNLNWHLWSHFLSVVLQHQAVVVRRNPVKSACTFFVPNFISSLGDILFFIIDSKPWSSHSCIKFHLFLWNWNIGYLLKRAILSFRQSISNCKPKEDALCFYSLLMNLHFFIGVVYVFVFESAL